ncbi:MAG: hypothetical protein MHM6MM_005397 [Cercozoa sp. M6MM]
MPPRRKRTVVTRVPIGNARFVMGKNLSYMRDSSDLLKQGRFRDLRQRLSNEGFLFLRGLVPREVALKARLPVLKLAHEKGALALPKGQSKATPEALSEMLISSRKVGRRTVLADGYTVDARTGGIGGERDPDFESWAKVGNTADVVAIYDGDVIHTLLDNLFGSNKDGQQEQDQACWETFPEHTWLRLKENGGATIEHADYYYFKRDTAVFEEGGTTLRDSGDSVGHQAGRPAVRRLVNVQRKKSDVSSHCIKCADTQPTELLHCGLCGLRVHDTCLPEELQQARQGGGFGQEGAWHCTRCANGPLGVFTMWTCLTDLESHKRSMLAVCPRSHTLQGVDQVPPGTQVQRSYWQRRKELPWVIPETLSPGDVIVFNIKTVHAASFNTSKQFRCSFDTRFQLLRPVPLDQVSNGGHDMTEEPSEPLEHFDESAALAKMRQPATPDVAEAGALLTPSKIEPTAIDNENSNPALNLSRSTLTPHETPFQKLKIVGRSKQGQPMAKQKRRRRLSFSDCAIDDEPSDASTAATASSAAAAPVPAALRED